MEASGLLLTAVMRGLVFEFFESFGGDLYRLRVHSARAPEFIYGQSQATATASSIAATKIDNQPTFFIAYIVTEAITQAAIVERIIYGRRNKRFVEGKKANFRIGLN